jgi:hypothetical protein
MSGTEQITAELASIGVFGSWDAYVSDVYSISPNDSIVGRTFGALLDSGSFDRSSPALLYRLTGSLAETFGTAPSWLMSNPFGVPVIPPSSSSLIVREDLPQSQINAERFIFPVPSLEGLKNLESVASNVNPEMSLDELAISFVSSSYS